nr:MAG TPA: hypothetical protein [Caudoviricetes sp.]
MCDYNKTNVWQNDSFFAKRCNKNLSFPTFFL